MRRLVIVLLSLFFVFIVIIFPLSIHVLYKIPSPNNWWTPEWGAADALQYYMAILTFISTTILGVVALKQSTVASRQTLLNENKLGIYLKNGEKACIEVSDFSIGLHHIELRLLINYIPSIVPTNSIISDISIKCGIMNRNWFEITRRDIHSNVFIKTESQIELSIIIDDPQGIYYKAILDPKKIQYYNLGFYEDGAFENNHKMYIKLNVGLYSGNVVTPAYISMDLKPYHNSIEYTNLEIRKCTYEINDVVCIIKQAVFAKEYERSLNMV